MDLDIITVSQGGTCAIIQTECCVFILDKSTAVLSVLNHLRTQVKGLRELSPSLRDLINQWFRSWGGKNYYLFGNYYLNLDFLCLYCCCDSYPQGNQIAAK